MTAQAAQQKINTKVDALSTPTLKDMAGKLMASDRDGSEIVLSAVLDALMGRLPEAEFVTFCEGL